MDPRPLLRTRSQQRLNVKLKERTDLTKRKPPKRSTKKKASTRTKMNPTTIPIATTFGEMEKRSISTTTTKDDKIPIASVTTLGLKESDDEDDFKFIPPALDMTSVSSSCKTNEITYEADDLDDMTADPLRCVKVFDEEKGEEMSEMERLKQAERNKIEWMKRLELLSNVKERKIIENKIKALEDYITSITVDEELKCQNLSKDVCHTNSMCIFTKGWLGSSIMSRCNGKTMEALSLYSEKTILQDLEKQSQRLEALQKNKYHENEKDKSERLFLTSIMKKFQDASDEAKMMNASVEELQERMRKLQLQHKQCQKSKNPCEEFDIQMELVAKQLDDLQKTWLDRIKTWTPFILKVAAVISLASASIWPSWHVFWGTVSILKSAWDFANVFAGVGTVLHASADILGKMSMESGEVGNRIRQNTILNEAAMGARLGAAFPGGSGQVFGSLYGAGKGVYKYFFSDKRLKINLEPLEKLNPKVKKFPLRMYRFQWTQEAYELFGLKGQDIGVLAQDALIVYPDTVFEHKVGDKTFYFIDYMKLDKYLQDSLNETDRILNPKTGNMILKSSPLGRRLVKLKS